MVSVAIRDVSDRKRAETALQDAYARLSLSVRDLERHDREMTLVNEMGDMLQTCLTGAEANDVISRYGRQLFASASGAVFTARPSVSVFEPTASWGADAVASPLQRDECWALRRSRVYAVEDAEGGPTCPHVGLAPAHGYVCVPMMAQGEALGLLHVRAARPGPEDSVTFQSQRTLAVTVGEHLALAMANLTLRETLRHQSVSDPLTGLYNRRYLQDQLARELQRASAGRRPVAVVVADIDRFKQANDALGHGAGDEILRAVARKIEASVRGVDTVCRWGGDEFVLVLPDSPLDVAHERARQLATAVRGLGEDLDGSPTVTLSIGVAVFPDHGTTADALLRAADAAMYASKAAGRDGVTSATKTARV
jgi:diguanylate cyclase (GGDEF)-like protein